MTTISARVVAHSRSTQNNGEIVTMLLRYPKFIHGEFMTHRVFSRNASSSRAIPVERLIEDIERDPVVPMFWGKNQRGMQAGEEHNSEFYLTDSSSPYTREDAWRRACDNAMQVASSFMMAGYHKQVVNRLLEPFSHINVVVTSTKWANFEGLRCHADAEPHMRLLAERMREARLASSPVILKPGQWHTPFVEIDNPDMVDPNEWPMYIQQSVARCARTSYLTHDGKEPDPVADERLHDMLIRSTPMHASPAEHQATPDGLLIQPRQRYDRWDKPHLHGNFVGWCQYRKMLPGENIGEEA